MQAVKAIEQAAVAECGEAARRGFRDRSFTALLGGCAGRRQHQQ